MPVINVRGSTYTDSSGAVYYRYRSDVAPNGNFASGDFRIKTKRGVVEYTEEQAYQKALAASYTYLGIDPTREIESYNESVDRENRDRAVIEALHKRREEARQGFGGRFSDIAMQDVTNDPGEYLPSYIQKLPQAQAESMIKAGKIGGWKVGDRYFRTQQEANEYITRNQRTTKTQQTKPWQPSLYPEIQASKDIKKKFDNKYEPYVTIEGTTLYKSKGQPESVTVPRFGKMVPAKPDPATKFVSEKFEESERFVSDKLMLNEILNPVIKTLETRERPLTLIERRSRKTVDKSKTLVSSEVAIGALTGIRDKPLTAAGNAAFALLVTKGAGALVSKIPILAKGIGTGAVMSKVNAVNLLGVGLAGMYGYDVAGRYSQASNKGRFVGEVAATEVIPFAVGGYIGTKPLRIKSNINTAIKLLHSQKEPIKSFIRDESASVIIKRKPVVKMPGQKLIESLSKEKGQGDIFSKQPETAYDRFMKDLDGYKTKPEATWVKKYSAKKTAEKPYLAQKTKIPKREVILTGTTVQKSKRGFREVKPEQWDKTLELVKQQQKTIQITKTEVKTKPVQAVKTKQIVTTKTKPKEMELYSSIGYVSAATRLMNQLKTDTQTASRTISKEQAPSKAISNVYTSEVIKALSKVQNREKTREMTAERLKEKVAVAEKVRVRERTAEITASKPKLRVPEKPALLSSNKFKSQLNDYVRKRKRKGKYIWDVNNPVPTLRSLTG